MNFNENELLKLLDELKLDKEIKADDIPKLELYMDQVITLFETELGHLKRSDKDKILTKTMINNYTKEKVLMPPDKKKYTREHIMMLAIIYYSKQVLSIGDIKLLFKYILQDAENNNNINIEELYTSFLEIRKNKINVFNEEFKNDIKVINEKSETIDNDNKDMYKMMLTVLSLINSANIQKKLAEKIIDNYFAD